MSIQKLLPKTCVIEFLKEVILQLQHRIRRIKDEDKRRRKNKERMKKEDYDFFFIISPMYTEKSFIKIGRAHV